MNLFTKPAQPTGTNNDRRLCFKIWPALTHASYDVDQYAHLASYVKKKAVRFQYDLDSYTHNTQDDLLAVMATLRQSIDLSRSDVMRAIPSRNQGEVDETSRLRTLSIAASLCLTINVEAPELNLLMKKRNTISWGSDSSLRDTVSPKFDQRQGIYQQSATGTIDQRLSIHGLVTYHGFTISWTDNLYEHLEVKCTKNSRFVVIYQHKIWLLSHLETSQEGAVPRNILEECLDTLDLLFPHGEKDSISLLKGEGKPFYGLGCNMREVSYELESYPHWGRKLKTLLEVLEEPPKGMQRFLPGRNQRNLFESVNFWIAVAVAVLAVTGFVLSLVAVVYTKLAFDVSKESLEVEKVSLDLAGQQYLLSLAQACTDPDSSDTVLQFCQRSK
ncbi:hypothetical protein BGZ63DRAFT_425376 [Mariannaea sp. PMI_226]|nr:hypothetical protein BGZ63DRAFT_425376 [Mariannaea sp. PMI_226]